jgi:hypothetical protein
MQLRLPSVALALALSLIVGPLQAQAPPPTDGRTCFCLRHATSGQVIAGCTAISPPNATYARATCWDAEAAREGPPFSVDGRWSVVPNGEDACALCDRRQRRNIPEVPRLPQ